MRYAMVEKIMLSDKEYEYLTKGIAIGDRKSVV